VLQNRLFGDIRIRARKTEQSELDRGAESAEYVDAEYVDAESAEYVDAGPIVPAPEGTDEHGTE
jgi:hypothetical protein